MDNNAVGNTFNCVSLWTLLQALHTMIGCKITGDIKVEIWHFLLR